VEIDPSKVFLLHYLLSNEGELSVKLNIRWIFCSCCRWCYCASFSGGRAQRQSWNPPQINFDFDILWKSKYCTLIPCTYRTREMI
jgi:hypothetical protein